MRREDIKMHFSKGQALLRMFVLMIAMLCMTSAFALSANAQNTANMRVSLNLRTVNVKDFFNEVNRQCGLNFFCKSDLANSLPRITVVEENKPVEDVLEKVFNTLNCDYKIDGNYLKDYPGRILYKVDGDNIKDFYGRIILQYQNGYLKGISN